MSIPNPPCTSPGHYCPVACPEMSPGPHGVNGAMHLPHHRVLMQTFHSLALALEILWCFRRPPRQQDIVASKGFAARRLRRTESIYHIDAIRWAFAKTEKILTVAQSHSRRPNTIHSLQPPAKLVQLSSDAYMMQRRQQIISLTTGCFTSLIYHRW